MKNVRPHINWRNTPWEPYPRVSKEEIRKAWLRIIFHILDELGIEDIERLEEAPRGGGRRATSSLDHEFPEWLCDELFHDLEKLGFEADLDWRGGLTLRIWKVKEKDKEELVRLGRFLRLMRRFIK